MGVEKIKVVIAKPGLDGHDRGAKVVARALRDAGIEVIYTGLHQPLNGARICRVGTRQSPISIQSSAHCGLSRGRAKRRHTSCRPARRGIFCAGNVVMPVLAAAAASGMNSDVGVSQPST